MGVVDRWVVSLHDGPLYASALATGFLIELGFLDGRSKLDVPAEALMTFD